jgi:hypothetical protein
MASPISSQNKGSSNAVNMLDSMQKFNGTNTASVSSFAYTSNKAVPKYSPARQPKAGASNTPMSYSGPPNEEEMQRNAKRHLSGNRNFANESPVIQP